MRAEQRVAALELARAVPRADGGTVVVSEGGGGDGSGGEGGGGEGGGDGGGGSGVAEMEVAEMEVAARV